MSFFSFLNRDSQARGIAFLLEQQKKVGSGNKKDVIANPRLA